VDAAFEHGDNQNYLYPTAKKKVIASVNNTEYETINLRQNLIGFGCVEIQLPLSFRWKTADLQSLIFNLLVVIAKVGGATPRDALWVRFLLALWVRFLLGGKVAPENECEPV
jgi:hypothetical protein